MKIFDPVLAGGGRLGTLGEARVIFNGPSSCSLTPLLRMTRLREMKGGREGKKRTDLDLCICAHKEMIQGAKGPSKRSKGNIKREPERIAIKQSVFFSNNPSLQQKSC